MPTFDLLPPKFEYSLYYPAMLLSEDMSEAQIERYNPLNTEQYLAELRNMVAHGCTNPLSYVDPELDKDGEIHFTRLSRYLDLREKTGMGPGGPLYIFEGGGVILKSGDLTAEEKRSSAAATRKVVAWARARGYSEVYFMAVDEYSGERLRGERDSFEAIHAGGGKIFVACYNDFFEIVGDLLDCPVLQHPGNLIVDQHQSGKLSSRDFLLHRQRMVTYDSELMMMPHIQKMIRGVHKNGFKIFSYMDPYGSHPEPQWHRRHRGLGLWKIGLNGTMTWAYTHIWEKARIFGDPEMEENGMGYTAHGFVLRGAKGVLDSLSWEAYREGYDDARYLATLQDAIARAKAAGRHERLAARTDRWLDNITVDADLDAWR